MKTLKRQEIGNFLVRFGFGILFIWGGLEKFIEGFLGGVGLDNMAGFLGQHGLSFLGTTGLMILAVVISVLELAGGILLIANKFVKYAAAVLGLIIIGSLALVYVPALDWMNLVIHFALATSLIGLALEQK